MYLGCTQREPKESNVKTESGFFATITAADMDIQSKTKDRDRVAVGSVSRHIQHSNMCAEALVNLQASLLMKELERE